MDELNNKTSRNKSEILNDNSNHNSITKPFIYSDLPLFFVPAVMRVFHTHSPCLEEGGA
jgi:hypothetical protein